MMSTPKEFAVRGQVFSLTDDPNCVPGAWLHLDDGLVHVVDGRIKSVTPSPECIDSLSQAMPVYEYPDCLICPGFVDSHVHYAQTRIVGSSAAGLLEWLETFTFPEELRFSDSEYAGQVAYEFLDEILLNGTTSALVYPTVHAGSAETFFRVSDERGMRMVAGKVLMDTHAPNGLLDGADFGMPASEQLIRNWHGRGRQTYAITLRFAATSSHRQMAACQELISRYPDLVFHTHLSETVPEIEWTLKLYPDCEDYLAVYEKYGMVSSRSVFAHGIHLSDSECERLLENGATVALCPTSNLFLGSGMVDSERLGDYGINLSMGTDVGGGTSFSMLQTMHEMYKVSRTHGIGSSAVSLFYAATLGGARGLGIDQYVGSFKPGKEADFVILDAGNRELTARKFADARNIEQLLFAYIILGGSANVRETWCMGKRLYQRNR